MLIAFITSSLANMQISCIVIYKSNRTVVIIFQTHQIARAWTQEWYVEHYWIFSCEEINSNSAAPLE